MKAAVQFNEFVGTAAADATDSTYLDNFLKSKDIDTNLYSAVGARFYAVENGYFEVSIICKDLSKSTALKNHLIAITFEQGVTKDEFFAFFKRFELVVTGKHYVHDSIKEEIVL